MKGRIGKPYITYEDLCRMPSDGNRYELFEGEAYVVPSPDFWHQEVLGNLYSEFRAAIADGSVVLFAPMDVILAPATVPQPDLIFVRAANRGVVQDRIRGAPDLVAEVLSRSTESRDRGLKMETYARYRISEYWLVDPKEGVIEIYRLDPQAAAYRLAEVCREGAFATTPLLPELRLDVARLFAERLAR